VGTSTDGTVISYWDYNCRDDVPDTIQAFMGNMGATQSAIWAASYNPASRDVMRERRRLFVRTAAVDDDAGAQVQDFATLYYHVISAGNTSGNFYLQYDVELHVPVTRNMDQLGPGGSFEAEWKSSAGSFFSSTT